MLKPDYDQSLCGTGFDREYIAKKALRASLSEDDRVFTEKIANLEFIPISVPYTHREVSSLVNRDGVTDIIVKATTDEGLIGWGESSSGADVKSVHGALEAMKPFVIGRDPGKVNAFARISWQATTIFVCSGVNFSRMIQRR